MDEELRALAFNTLQALMLDFPDWREDVLSGFVYFIVREVTDVHPTLLDNAVKMLVQLINQWKQAAQMQNKNQDSQVPNDLFLFLVVCGGLKMTGDVLIWRQCSYTLKIVLLS